jgi:hypothetical protein
MADNPIGKKYEIKEDSFTHRLYGVPIGSYEVYVGEFGWDDGDMYIRVRDRKWKLKDLD